MSNKTVKIIATPEALISIGVDGDLSGEMVKLTGKDYGDGYVQVECPPSKVMLEVSEKVGTKFPDRLYDVRKFDIK